MKLFRFLPHADTKKDPDSLLRLFVVTALVSIVVITSLAGYAFYRVLEKNVVDSAEEDAIKISSALLEDQRAQITSLRDGVPVVSVAPEKLLSLDRQLRKFLSPFDIVKIKIYSSDDTIVYSTEAKLIGHVDRGNLRLARALAGSFDSKIERKEEVKDLAEELKFNVDVVETYIPIRAPYGRVIGSFEVYIDVTKYRQQTMKAALLSLASLCTILTVVFAISFVLIRRGTNELKEIQEVLKKQTLIDGLTGCFNKRHIELIGRREFARAQRRREKGIAGAEVGFIMLDIDRFKQINDRFGHLAGDMLLQQFVQRMTTSLRSYDSIGRFGGEEFLVVLPGADREQTLSVAHKIWALIREEPFHVEGQALRVTASAGVATVLPGDDDLLQVLKRADQNLYQAKSEGRDRVV